jgi:putative salt-induced outer membrane protein YdiY
MGARNMLLALGALLWLVEAALADEAIMRNGDRLTGTLLRMVSGHLIWRSPYAGEISLAWPDIATLRTDEPVQILLDDETVLNGLILTAGTGRVRIRAPGLGATEPIELARITYINPPPEVIGQGVTVSGVVNLGFTGTQGNSETMQLHGDFESVFKGKTTRYTIGGEINHESESGRNTVANWQAYTKYDAFLTPKWYLFANLGVERDRFKDLNLRTNLGPGSGYYVWKSERRNFSLEGGFNYVKEDLIAAPDRYYGATRWSVDLDYFVYRRIAQFFHRHVGLVGLESNGNVVIRSKTGFRLPLTDHLSTTLQVDVDWDSDPSPGAESTDTRYIVKVGYLW